jgi:glycerate kinase
MTQVLVAPQEFKGTLTAREVADCLAQVLKTERPGWKVDLLPLADGGPGTLELLASQLPTAIRHTARVEDPLGQPIDAWWLQHGETAFIEMALASGLSLRADRRPLDATTTGTGQLLRAALQQGATRLIVGMGGSATTDGGAGALHALGFRFFDDAGHALSPSPRELVRCVRLERPALEFPTSSPSFPTPGHFHGEVWTDVRNPLLGPHGAAAMYGPQKGASPADVAVLERALERLAALAPGLAEQPGSGAAGGLAFGLSAFAGLTLSPAFPSLASLIELDGRLARADLVLTGEGRLDEQTTFDKGPWALAGMAKSKGVPVHAFVGKDVLGATGWQGTFTSVTSCEGFPGAPRERLALAVRRWLEGTPRS